MAVEKDYPAVMLEATHFSSGPGPCSLLLAGNGVHCVEDVRGWGNESCGVLGAWELLLTSSVAGIVLCSEVSLCLH